MRTILLLLTTALATTACGASNRSPENTPASQSPAPRIEALRRGIARKSAAELTIERATYDAILDHEPELVAGSRMVPEQEHGNVVGIRLFGASPESLLGVLGIEDGDRIDAVNGADLATREKALAVLAGLRSADHVTVALNRRGRAMTLEYTIVQERGRSN